MIYYSQKQIGENSCSFVAILTNISNLLNRKLDINDMKEGYNLTRTEGRGALVNSNAIRRVVDWFNSKYGTRVDFRMCTATAMLEEAKKQMVYIGFRWNRESAYDFQVDGIINKCPSGYMEGGHSASIIFRNGEYVIVDNYQNERLHNEYRVSEEILRQMIAKQIIRGACYVFYVDTSKKKRILKIPS